MLKPEKILIELLQHVLLKSARFPGNSGCSEMFVLLLFRIFNCEPRHSTSRHQYSTTRVRKRSFQSVKMTFSSLSVWALLVPETKTKTTSEYKHTPNEWEIWPQKPLLTTRKSFLMRKNEKKSIFSKPP